MHYKSNMLMQKNWGGIEKYKEDCFKNIIHQTNTSDYFRGGRQVVKTGHSGQRASSLGVIF